MEYWLMVPRYPCTQGSWVLPLVDCLLHPFSMRRGAVVFPSMEVAWALAGLAECGQVGVLVLRADAKYLGTHGRAFLEAGARAHGYRRVEVSAGCVRDWVACGAS